MEPRHIATVALLTAGLVFARASRAQSAFDTRGVSHIRLTPKIELLATQAMRQPVETGFCLYGHATGDTLYVLDIVEGNVEYADSTNVSWACSTSPLYLGVAHTHIRPRQQLVCWPGGLTAADFEPILRQDPDVLYMILCTEGDAFLQLYDGRFDWFMWRSRVEPEP